MREHAGNTFLDPRCSDSLDRLFANLESKPLLPIIFPAPVRPFFLSLFPIRELLQLSPGWPAGMPRRAGGSFLPSLSIFQSPAEYELLWLPLMPPPCGHLASFQERSLQITQNSIDLRTNVRSTKLYDTLPKISRPLATRHSSVTWHHSVSKFPIDPIAHKATACCRPRPRLLPIKHARFLPIVDRGERYLSCSLPLFVRLLHKRVRQDDVDVSYSVRGQFSNEAVAARRLQIRFISHSF